jgi:OmpA-OmpF porin, OOP family
MFQKIAIAAALVIASSGAIAGGTSKFYAGADVGTTKLDGDANQESGYGAFAGYQLNQNIAVEAGVRRLADVDDSFGGVNFNSHLDQLSLSAVGTLPLSNGFSVFGRLGINRLNLKESGGGFTAKDHATRGLYGIGVAYSFSPAVSARLEVQKPASDFTNLSAGVSYKF